MQTTLPSTPSSPLLDYLRIQCPMTHGNIVSKKGITHGRKIGKLCFSNVEDRLQRRNDVSDLTVQVLKKMGKPFSGGETETFKSVALTDTEIAECFIRLYANLRAS